MQPIPGRFRRGRNGRGRIGRWKGTKILQFLATFWDKKVCAVFRF